MPEIAEIKVVGKTLKKSLIGKKINKIKVLYPRIIVGDVNDFTKKLEGCTFKNIKTYGKWLIFDLGEYSFLSHLRMEGKYFFVERTKPIEKHTHVVFELEGDMDLRYNDVRKFGRMELVESTKIFENPSIKKLGFEPEDESLTVDYLLNKFTKKDIPIKTALLDQTIINGLGNIYANEVLFASSIHPLRDASSITKEEAKKIINTSRTITKKSFEVGGCTIRSYTSSLGVIGHYQDYLKVHGKQGQKCPCGSIIEKIKIDGRSSYFCPKCQK